MQNQPNQPQGQPMGGQQMNQTMNRGGHEIFDAHGALGTTVGALDQYTMFRSYVKDPGLLDILDRQYAYMTTQYNRMVEAFQTGQKPSTPIFEYEMATSNDVQYGMQPSQPTKPITNVNEVKDSGIASQMLSLLKSTSSVFTMSAAEITNPVLRRVIADSISDFIEMSYEIFLYQNHNGNYSLPQIQQSEQQQMLGSFAPSQASGGNIH